MTLLNLFKYRAADPVQYRDDYTLNADDARRIAKALAIAQAVGEVFPSWQSHHYDRIMRRADELLEGR